MLSRLALALALGLATTSPALSRPGDARGLDRAAFETQGLRLFQDADADADGTLTVAEIEIFTTSPPVERIFARLDRDGDGRLTSAELAREGRGPGPRLVERLDADRDGAVSREEFRRGAAARHAEERHDAGRQWSDRFAVMLRGMDVNGDGRVNRDEFAAGITALFVRLDKDGNGRLSREEMPSPPRAPHP